MGFVAGPPRWQECQEAGGRGGGTQARHPDASIVDHAGSFRRHTRTSNGTTGRLTAENKKKTQAGLRKARDGDDRPWTRMQIPDCVSATATLDRWRRVTVPVHTEA